MKWLVCNHIVVIIILILTSSTSNTIQNNTIQTEFYAERARGGVGLIVTGGIAPNSAGIAYMGSSKMTTEREAEGHKLVTKAVHDNGGKIGSCYIYILVVVVILLQYMYS